MTKYLMLLAALIMVACGRDDGNDPVDKEQPDADTTLVWVTDQTYAGLEWSPLSKNTMIWQEAIDYCASMSARLPNINELRKIIINCPGSTYGGACKVSDPSCLSDNCWSEDCYCNGSADSYSVLGDGKKTYIWSSSSLVDKTDQTWSVTFVNGNIYPNLMDVAYRVRCVR